PPPSPWFEPTSSGTVPAGFSTDDTGHLRAQPAANAEDTSAEGRARARQAQDAATAGPSVFRAPDERQSAGSSSVAPAALPRRLDEGRAKPAAGRRPVGAEPSDTQETGEHTSAGLPRRVPRGRPAPDRAD